MQGRGQYRMVQRHAFAKAFDLARCHAVQSLPFMPDSARDMGGQKHIGQRAERRICRQHLGLCDVDHR